jgi:hypothetical protein
MSDKAFFDTNLPIAFVFQINSLHDKSKKAFNDYSKVYWSYFVKKEYERRYNEKLDNLLNFFQDFKFELENPTREFYTVDDMLNYAKRYGGKSKKDFSSSLYSFWNKYSGMETHLPFSSLKNNVSDCLNDLSINTEINGLNLERIMQLAPQRTKSYSNIDAMLKNHGVKDADRNVILDGHDFACFSSDPVDFVSFDERCYYGARNVEILCFDSIKGKYDFNAS